ncbi:uncharacterized protein Z520_01777 [Fonsecaea multimorphosa CBS 102226]|uniref:FHA domain-containing protein n=1 Tax=Fonsecaea multimorphosa CBS 102226 TaxID=1442371 RepID=A0A0D2KIK8_9EURO|nr:uncharacterized protein Z520_01777 [Fonsecaea multimorphosa CBS 102226]KIY03310.1 hypothetical protein Z520_01777 [Fonsecaea multimorphosa CBS 102226]OAL30227.1 hypothetical protein AYO22_01743 [Fonsecaea multimorphosa]
MADHSSSKYLNLTLRELDFREPIPKRTLTLEAPDWEVRIGRGTGSRIEELTPAENNAWFDSRVLSRRHAVLRANPTTKEIHIEDIGSMHGTFVAGKRLNTNQMEPLWPEDTVTLGSDVIRGSSHFSALRFKVNWTWCDGALRQPDPNQANAGMYQNTFSADYTDEEAYGDHPAQVLHNPKEDEYDFREKSIDYHSELDEEVQVIRDSVRGPSIEIVIPGVRTFTVPESDDASNTPSHDSGADVSDEDSPITSPLIPSHIQEDKDGAPADIPHIFHDAGFHTTNPDHADPSQVLVPSSAQQADLLPTMDEDAPEEDSYGDDELENEYSDSLSSLHNPSITIENSEQYLARTSLSGMGDHPEHARAPSPSDAAMVKPSIEPGFRATLAAPPFPKFDSSGQQPVLMDQDETGGRLGSAWAGHNSVLYEPVAQHVVSEQTASASYHACAPHATLYPDLFTFQTPTMSTKAPPASSLSIAGLIRQLQAVKDVDGARKRKADQISSDERLDPNTASSDSYSSEVGDMLATTATSKVGGARSVIEDKSINPSTSASEVAESPSADDIEMPLRKKAKKDKVKAAEQCGTGCNSFVTTAGATIAGMAIGAVGMFIGLLALPEDYFM